MDPKNTIIFSDMDGTLLTNWDYGPIIPLNNIIAIKKWLDLGGLFSIATGRNLKNVPQYFTDFPVDIPMVLLNGALLYLHEENKIIYEEKLSEQFIKEAIDYFEENKYISLVLSDEKEVYSIEHKDSKIQPILDFPSQSISVKDVYDLNVLKITYVTKDEYSTRVIKDVKRFDTKNDFNLLPSSNRFIEMVSKEATKGNGIINSLKYYDLQSKNLVVIGDYINDLDMFAIADIKAAPVNAHEIVKEKADIITVSNNEGAINDLIEKILKL